MGALFGFLNIDKPKGITSFDVIYKLRKTFGIKKIGHTGTLDPLATGVLPIAIGNAARLIEFLDDDKRYEATIKFGEISTTYDEEGEKTEVSKPDFSRDKLINTLLLFVGKIKQMPPIYSAIKIEGKKLYEFARAGKKVEEMPEIKQREIEIYEIRLLEFNLPFVKIEVHCSKGTYIRSLAHDIGQNLGCGAYLADLKRIQSGRFNIKNSINIENSKEELLKNIINPVEILPFRQYELDEQEFLGIKNGNSITPKENFLEDEKIILVFKGGLISISTQKSGIFRVDKVLNIC